MKKLQHKFVECVPKPLEDGILYVSIRFGIVSHNCCCGCGNEVVTNISPNGWRLTYDGESISLYPSIGNWDFKCRSHYWIVRDEVRWAERWSDQKIRKAREIDGFFGDHESPKGKKSILAKIKRKWRGR